MIRTIQVLEFKFLCKSPKGFWTMYKILDVYAPINVKPEGGGGGFAG